MAGYLDEVEKYLEQARVRSRQRKHAQEQKAKQEAAKAAKKTNSSFLF